MQLDSDRIALIKNEFHKLDAGVDLQAGGVILKIEYNFPATCFSVIWQLVKNHTGSAQFGLTANLVYTLRAYTEAVEQQHLLSQSGWDTYVRDIFVASHLQASAHRAGQKRKPLQQVKRPENPVVD